MATTFPDYHSNVPNFTDHPYSARSDFEYGGFKGLHDMASGALRGIFGEFEDFDGFRLNPDDLLDFSDENVDVNEMVAANTAPLVFATFGIIFAFILTVIGVVWCVGKLCCTCGWLQKKATTSWEYVENRFGKGTPSVVSSRPPKVKNSKVKIGLGILILCCNVVFFTFLIGLFMTNGQLSDSIGDLKGEIDGYLDDSEDFINHTKEQIGGVMKKSFADLNAKLVDICEDIPDGAAEVTLSELDESVSEIVQLLTALSPGAQLPPSLKSVVERKESIRKILNANPRAVNCAQLANNLIQAGNELSTNAEEMNAALDAVPIEQSREDLGNVEEVFQTANAAIFWSITFLNVVLLIILVTISVGTVMILVLPDNRVGSISLNCGLFTIFIMGWILWSFSLGLFFISGALVVIMPGAFDNVASNGSLVNSRSMGRADEYILPKAPYILTKCEDKDSAYIVFNLTQVYDVNQFDNLIEILIPTAPRSLPAPQGQTSGEELEMDLSRAFNGNVPRDQLARLGFLTSQLESNLKTIRATEEELKAQVDHYIEFAKDQIQTQVGTCEPLWNVMNSTIHTFSYKLGSPIGGYWFALNLILYLFFPIIITSVIFLRI